MQVSRKIISIVVYCVIIALGILAVIYITGSNIQPRLEISVQHFEWKNQTGLVILRFESDSGAFTTGNAIHVNARLFYPFNSNDIEAYLLYFPNTLSPDEYNKLSENKQWEATSNGTQIMFSSGFSENLQNLIGIPPSTEFDTIWTQEGLQDGYLIIGKSLSFNKDGSINLENATKLEKIINIQPTDVLQNLKTNNIVAGLTFAIIALTIATTFSKYEKIGAYLKD